MVTAQAFHRQNLSLCFPLCETSDDDSRQRAVVASSCQMFGKQCSFIVTECSSEEALALENLCLHFPTAQFQEDSFTLDLQVTGDAPTTSASPCTCRAAGQVTIVTGPFTSSVSPPWFPQPISCYNPPPFCLPKECP